MVKQTFLLDKDMHDAGAVVKQNPAAFAVSFFAQETDTLLFQFFLDIVGNCLHLGGGIGAADDKVIGHG